MTNEKLEISCFFVNLVFFIMKSSTFPQQQSGNTECNRRTW